MLLIARIFIRQDGKKISYSVQFRRGQFGKLQGRSGHHVSFLSKKSPTDFSVGDPSYQQPILLSRSP